MDTFQLLMLVSVGIVAAIELGRRHYQRKKEVNALRRHVAGHTVVPIRAVQNGQAQIEGRAVPIALSASPFSGRAAIGVRITIEKLEAVALADGSVYGSRGQALAWGPVLEAIHVNEFFVDDGTGLARVRTASCYPLFRAEPTVSIPVEQLLRPPLVDLLRSQHYPEHWLVGAREARVTEYLLEPGEMVFVFGEAHREVIPDERAGYRGTTWQVVMSAPPGGCIMISDQFRDELIGSMTASSEFLR